MNKKRVQKKITSKEKSFPPSKLQLYKIDSRKDHIRFITKAAKNYLYRRDGAFPHISLFGVDRVGLLINVAPGVMVPVDLKSDCFEPFQLVGLYLKGLRKDLKEEEKEYRELLAIEKKERLAKASKKLPNKTIVK